MCKRDIKRELEAKIKETKSDIKTHEKYIENIKAGIQTFDNRLIELKEIYDEIYSAYKSEMKKRFRDRDWGEIIKMRDFQLPTNRSLARDFESARKFHLKNLKNLEAELEKLKEKLKKQTAKLEALKAESQRIY